MFACTHTHMCERAHIHTHRTDRSDYRKSLPVDFIRIRLKIEQNCRLFLDNFSGAIMNDLFMTFTSGLKVDAKCVSAVKLDHSGELFWDTPS